ncbi:uncharacterized protein V1518DRAFT_167424 [Limtongia smithiae]|uniref:uncharacterized protein n=1 Tax=Limtongia smithiae TaxID=1125753 RepID=UPI0034CDFE00
MSAVTAATRRRRDSVRYHQPAQSYFADYHPEQKENSPAAQDSDEAKSARDDADALDLLSMQSSRESGNFSPKSMQGMTDYPGLTQSLGGASTSTSRNGPSVDTAPGTPSSEGSSPGYSRPDTTLRSLSSAASARLSSYDMHQSSFLGNDFYNDNRSSHLDGITIKSSTSNGTGAGNSSFDMSSISDNDVARIANLVIHIRDSKTIGGGSLNKRKLLSAANQGSKIEPSPATMQRVVKTKTWFELRAALIEKMQMTPEFAHVRPHPGVDGVYNPLQTIRNRYIRLRLGQKLELPTLLVLTPASTACRHNLNKRIIWEVDILEMYADSGWRDRSRLLMRDRDGNPLYDQPRSSEQKLINTADGDVDFASKDKDYITEVEEIGDGAANGRERHHHHHHHHHRHILGFGLPRELESKREQRHKRHAIQRQREEWFGGDEHANATDDQKVHKAHDLKLRDQAEYLDEDDHYDSSSETDSDSYSGESGVNLSDVSESDSESDNELDHQDSQRADYLRSKSMLPHIISRDSSRSSSPAKSQIRTPSPFKPAGNSSGSYFTKLEQVLSSTATATEGLLTVPVSGNQDAYPLSRSRRTAARTKSPRQRLKSESSSSSSSNRADLSMTSLAAGVNVEKRRNRSAERSAAYKESSISKIMFTPANGPTQSHRELEREDSELQPTTNIAATSSVGLTRLDSESVIIGNGQGDCVMSNRDSQSSLDALPMERSHLARVVAELEILEARFLAYGRSADFVCRQYTKKLDVFTDQQGPMTGQNSVVSIPVLSQAVTEQTDYFNNKALAQYRAELSTLSSRTDKLTSSLTSEYRPRFDYAISAADQLAAEVMTTLSLQARRVGESLDTVDRHGKYCQGNISHTAGARLFYAVLEHAVTFLLWGVWGIVTGLKIARSCTHYVWVAVKWVVWC